MKPLRVVALVVTIVNVVFNFAVRPLHLLPRDVDQVSAQYANDFTPAGFTFAIWAVIYASWLVFAVALLVEKHAKENRALDVLVPGFIALNVACSLWLALFSFEALVASLVLIVAQAIVAWHLAVRAARLVESEAASVFTTVPFALIAGWLTVAACANLTVVLVAHGALPEAAQAPVALALLALCAFAGVVGAIRTGPVVPLVIAWAAFGLHRRDIDVGTSGATTVAVFAIIAAAVLAAVAAWAPVGRWGLASAHVTTRALERLGRAAGRTR